MIVGVMAVLALSAWVSPVAAEGWRWPDDMAVAESTRIDGKVHFDDAGDDDTLDRFDNMKDDEPFHQPQNTQGFYNRPPGSGQYHVRVEPDQTKENYRVDANGIRRVYNIYNQNRVNRQQSEGSDDSLAHCTCVSELNCRPRTDLPKTCAPGLHLCCDKPQFSQKLIQRDFFNEVDNDRTFLLPSQGGSFLSAQNLQKPAILVGPQGPTGNIGPSPVLFGPNRLTGVFAPGIKEQPSTEYQDIGVGSFQRPNNRGVLVGPDGPTGIIGPTTQGLRENYPPSGPGVLVGPEGPTGIIGPQKLKQSNLQSGTAVLVGPGGPTGIVGPSPHTSGANDREDLTVNQPKVLVGPEGPTGIIGPAHNEDNRVSASAQRILVGPGGPTGIIGPRGNGRPVLVGPGGPTGRIGPDYGRRNPGILVGPEGPTGVFGPRRVLVGPGGPTGRIGPPNYFFGK